MARRKTRNKQPQKTTAAAAKAVAAIAVKANSTARAVPPAAPVNDGATPSVDEPPVVDRTGEHPPLPALVSLVSAEEAIELHAEVFTPVELDFFRRAEEIYTPAQAERWDDLEPRALRPHRGS